MTTYYLPTIFGALLVCMALAAAMPALRRPVMVVELVLLGAMAFAPDIAVGLRVFAAAMTAVFAVQCVRQLRRS